MRFPSPSTAAIAVLISTIAFPALLPAQSVIITEFVADNSRLEDEDTDSPSWIEIQNVSDEAVRLKDWSLTDDPTRLDKWKLPSATLEPGAYRVIFASGKDRLPGLFDVNTGELHSNFRLADDAGYLALVEPDGTTIASEYTYEAQEEDVAYGVADGVEGYLYPPTPGEANSRAPQEHGRSEEVAFSHPGGFIDEVVMLSLEAPNTPDAKIYLTVDGSEPQPTLFSTAYASPIRVDKTMTVRARVVAPGHLPGPVSSRTFTMTDESLSQFAGTGEVFETNLPIIFLDSRGANIDNNATFQPAFATIITPDPETGRAKLTDPAEYIGPCAARRRGESSAGFNQRSYALEIRDEEGFDRDVSLLGMPEDSDWVLYGPWSEKTLMRNKLVFDWMRELRGDDGTSVRSRHCELFFKQTADDRATYASSYRGIYILIEKIKRGKDRVPIAKLNEKTKDPEMITGGYIFRQDKPDSGKNNWTTSGFSIALQSFDPDRFSDKQVDYLRGYINDFEAALRGPDFLGPEGYRAYLDPDSFIDAQWMIEVSKQVDAYVFSTYYHKDRGGKLRAGPLWDFNISLGNADYATGDRAEGWLYDNREGRGQDWYPRLHDDPEYHLTHWDRYWHMRQRFLATEAVWAQIDEHARTLLDGYTEPVGNREPESVQNPVARHFRKWPHLGQRQWPNPATETNVDSYQDEIDFLKDWIETRLDWLDDQSIVVDNKIHRAPVFSAYGGNFSGSFELTISRFKGGLFDANRYANGTIYYTTNGSDPRLAGGELNAEAQVYEEPLVLENAAVISARLRNGDTWSPITTAKFLVNSRPAAAGNLIVSEIMYHPADPTEEEQTAGFIDGGAFEYIELTNIGTQTIDLSGVSLVNGVGFTFETRYDLGEAHLLEAGEQILIVGNLEGFKRRHPEVPMEKIAGIFQARLDNAGERLALVDRNGDVIVDFTYDDEEPWPVEADGDGYSLVYAGADASLDPALPASWQRSPAIGGDPGVHGGDPNPDPTPDPTLDTDGDGLVDLIEIALGSDPEKPGALHLPRASRRGYSVDGIEADYVVLEYRRDPAVVGFQFALELSDDLRTWVDGEGILAESIDNEDGTLTETLRSSDPLGDATRMRYARLRVSAPAVPGNGGE